MKITAIRATPINLPIEAPYLWSFGWLPGSSRTVVEVETSEGLVGLGEAGGGEEPERPERAAEDERGGNGPTCAGGHASQSLERESRKVGERRGRPP